MKKSLFKPVLSLFCILSSAVTNIHSQVIPTNASPVGMEHNILFNAVTRYTVTQSGQAQVNLNMLFDGNFSPSYTSIPVSASDPTVITIEGLPGYHTQRGAWIGWSTRYWPAKKFRIEGFETYYSGAWITIADQDNYTNGEFSVRLPDGAYTKIRFIFYSGSTDPYSSERMGLSEIFLLHPEATSPYQGLLKYDEGPAGNTNVGQDNGPTDGYGSKLNFLGASFNTDALWMSRYNNGYNNSELRVNIGDDLGQSADKFVVGVIHCGDNLWHPLLTVQNDRNIIADGKITATEIQVKQNVWSDFVFQPAYKLISLPDLDKYIKTYGHLPEIPSASDVVQNGINLGSMQSKLLQKIEELTLYSIGQDKKITELEKTNALLQEEINQLKELIVVKLK